MAKIKVAVIGYGQMGRWHTSKVAASAVAELAAVVETDPSASAQAAQARWPVVAELKEVLAHIDAAIIATPASTHYVIARELLAAHKHVFCEKPVTLTVAEAQTLQNMASKVPGLVFQVGHSERWAEIWEWFTPAGGPPGWPGAAMLRVPGTWYFKRLAPFSGRGSDTDVVADLMIHDIDLMLWHLAALPQEVVATGHKIRTAQWDHVTAGFKFASGHQVWIMAGRHWPSKERGLTVVNELGVLQIDLLNQQARWAARDQAEALGPLVFKYAPRDHLQREQESFYQAIQEQRRPLVGLAEGKDALAVGEMVQQALRQTVWIKKIV